MSSKLDLAGGLAVAVMFATTLVSAEGSYANAQSYPAFQSYPVAAATPVTPVTEPVTSVTKPQVQPLPAPSPKTIPVEPAQDDAAPPAPAAEARSLGQLVSDTPTPQKLSSELDCLAGAIYFEARGESLAGRLAVGRVIVARAKSGRFPASYCGVVYQRSQFSFVRGRSMPAIDKSGKSWAEAARIARIAHEGSWKSPVEGALFFHAARVSPGWRLTRLARVDNHVFYR